MTTNVAAYGGVIGDGVAIFQVINSAEPVISRIVTNRNGIVVSLSSDKGKKPRGEGPKICPRCGALMPPDASYCGVCGARLA